MLKSVSKLKTWDFFRNFRPKPKFFLQVNTQRATLEFLLGFGLLSGLLLILQTEEGSLFSAIIFALLFNISLATLRLKLFHQNGQKSILSEGPIMARFLVVVCAVWSFFFIYSLWNKPDKIFIFSDPTRTNYYYFSNLSGLLVVTILFFILFRGVLYLWNWLDIRQKRHLRWALTYAHFKLAIGLIFIIYGAFIFTSLSLAETVSEGFSKQISDVGSFFYFLFSLLLFFALISILILLVIAPIFIIFSNAAMKPSIRKLETLAAATRQLHEGDYTTRIEVVGEDEIAQLQGNFNQMTGKLEETLHALEAERDTVKGLLQSNRELVATVSHELRTPIAAVRGYIEALLNWEKATPPPTLHHDLEIVQRETLRLQTLIDDLFLLSRAEVGRLTLNLKNADPGPVVQRTIEAAAPLAWHNRKVQLVNNLPAQLPPVQLDETRLEQILSNLIQNAIRHTAPGGLIVVTAQLQTAMLELAVRDTGEGIAAADLPYIWQRFYKANQAGTGLGLAIVKELTEALGGTVAVESEVGKGSSFKINLVLAQPPAK